MIIEKTQDTPSIYLSASPCKFEIKGNSYYIGVYKLYEKIHKWIDKEIPKLECEMNCVFHFKFISSASIKSIVDIIHKLDKYYETGKKIKITWISDKYDTDNFEIATDFLDFTKMPLNIVEKY